MALFPPSEPALVRAGHKGQVQRKGRTSDHGQDEDPKRDSVREQAKLVRIAAEVVVVHSGDDDWLLASPELDGGVEHASCREGGVLDERRESSTLGTPSDCPGRVDLERAQQVLRVGRQVDLRGRGAEEERRVRCG